MQRFLLAAAVILPSLLHAQIGGTRIFNFITLPSSSRESATGGSLITVKDDDVGLAFQNPSMLNKAMHDHFHASTVVYYAGLNYGNFNYARHYDSIATFQVGLQYMAYGEFDQTDITGQVTGEFNASEYCLNIGASRELKRYTFGANLKFIFSQLESYNSFAGALDLAASYHHPVKNFTATLLLKNIGIQFKPYYSDHRESLPFEIQAGFSVKFKHLPFRLSVTLHNLQNFNTRYEDPNSRDNNSFLSEDTVDEGVTAGEVFDEIFRHFIFAGEIYIKKRVVILGFAYNHQRRQELKSEGKKGLAGLSFGIKINIKQFSVGYAPEWYHFAGPVHHISLGVNFNELLKKKQVNTL